MSLPEFIADRGTWDAQVRHRIDAIFPDRERDAEEHSWALERVYPLTSTGAAHELKARGLHAHPAAIVDRALANGLELQKIGRANIWFPSDIDTMAEWLADARKFTPTAEARRAIGISASESFDRQGGQSAKRCRETLELVARRAGVSIAEAWAGAPEDLPRWPCEWTDSEIEAVVHSIALAQRERIAEIRTAIGGRG